MHFIKYRGKSVSWWNSAIRANQFVVDDQTQPIYMEKQER